MGSGDSRSKFEHGNIILQTDKPYYAPGEFVTGKIYLYLQQEFPGDKLELEIYGNEKVEWIVKKTKRHDKVTLDIRPEFMYEHDIWGNRYLRVKDKQLILSYTYPIYQFVGGVALAGQYTFPFQLQLPKDAPSSCNYTNYNESESMGQIKYSLKASLSATDSSSIQPMTFKQTLIVRQLPPQLPSSSGAERSEEIDCCGCFCKSGTVHLKTQWEKTAYTPQETVRVIAEIDNSKVTRKVAGIKIQLNQHILLSRREENIDFFTEDKVYSYTTTLIEKAYEGIGEGQKTSGMDRYFEIDLSEYKIISI